MPTNPDIEFFVRTDREVTPSNPDMDTWQKPKHEADGGQGLAKAY